METVAASNGGFAFCPVPQGAYDVAAVAIDGSGNTYAATVITGVQPGNSLGTVPLTPAGMPASIVGQITTSSGSAGTAADLVTSALQSIGGSVLATVPLAQQSASTATLTTAPRRRLPSQYRMRRLHSWRSRREPEHWRLQLRWYQNPAAPASGSVNYFIDANAFVPGSAGQSDCNSSNLQPV